MKSYSRTWEVSWLIIGLAILSFFSYWTESNPELVHVWTKEDGPVESWSSVFFGLASLCFAIFTWRSRHLKNKTRMIYFFPICWTALMFVFMGEEVSWGQRIFDFDTPEGLSEINLQNETNLHNLEVLHTFLGGKFRYLSIMMLATGLAFPLFAMTAAGKRMVQKFAFPVAPIHFAPFFVGAYLFGKLFYPDIDNDAAEVREFVMSVGMFGFALTGARFPCRLFRVCEPLLSPSSRR